MPRAQRLVLVVVCAAVLVLVGSWKTGVDAVGQAQSQSGSQGTQSSIDALVLKAFQWRSIGPLRGGRSIAVERRQGAAEGGLLRRGRRRPLEDDRRRRELGAGDRRPDQQLLGRRGRRLGVESRHRLHRHGRVVHPRQHHAGRRRLQVDRRRQDVDAHRLRAARRRSRRSASIRPIPTSSSSPSSASTARRATSAASSRAPTAARPGSESAVPRRQDRRGRHRDRPHESERACTPRCGRRTASSTRCRAAARAAASSSRPTAARPGPRSRATPGCRPASSAASASPSRAPTRTASTRSSRTRTAGSSRSDDAGATWTLVNEQPQHPAARVLLHARHRRSGQPATPSTC